ncbi:D-isomer specific 2-hydroxyacid dehydrogenase, NAD binding domain protein [Burkholderia multivorans]|uniref:D-isomer specific 2-hydroxyacid dehydrogenase, NAD binding domain protein n=1 Tax=Burkholderia multivorans TaxID=87883 RepID=A0ABD7L9A7_9BURK|nr:hydroxyacid dehydrogenase [Burkholderia multivorans]KVQ83840.1 hydroxyacid dehydrogenase [Burkholderia multivorans]MCO8592794.1 hydroxyacid dehydrogenase [Burkholderia multivorans]MCO8625031.1 hydroxyacid dehydrogenase [Burkholderia multivorans]MCO8630046.1 hydroxyacid dehydrogenase [Burkholderia multivorans]SAJ95390.1 D-isomer specific 2-hydroxyacid dehydrogenase, NAD binding domain protein [Burkholderia multivorans]
MKRVFVTHPAAMLDRYFGAKAMRALTAIADVACNPLDRELTTDELIDAAQRCDAMIAYRQTPAPRALFAALPQLAAFLRCAVDIRTVDVDAASAFGVLVTQASPGFAAAVAEWVVGAMIDLARGIGDYAHAYRRGAPPVPQMGRELRGSTLGLIGYGQIARHLAPIATALGMRVLVSDPYVRVDTPAIEQVEMDTLLGAADFVVCLAPANAATENLIDARAFARMKPDAYFINASRGELVDERALADALDGGRLAGCALDVGRAPDQMPTPALAAHPRVIATPHVGGLTLPAIEHQALETVDQFAALLDGRLPVGAVNGAHATRVARWRSADATAAPHAQ